MSLVSAETRPNKVFLVCLVRGVSQALRARREKGESLDHMALLDGLVLRETLDPRERWASLDLRVTKVSLVSQADLVKREEREILVSLEW